MQAYQQLVSHSRVFVPAALFVALLSTGCNVRAMELEFNRGWKFRLGDIPEAAEASLDDSDRMRVNTPHDWAIGGLFDPQMHGYASKLPWQGVGWYRKHFKVEAEHNASRVYLDFEGVMACPKVYVNGKLAGEWDFGNTPFCTDSTPQLQFGKNNVVAKKVDTKHRRTQRGAGSAVYIVCTTDNYALQVLMKRIHAMTSTDCFT